MDEGGGKHWLTVDREGLGIKRGVNLTPAFHVESVTGRAEARV